MKIDWSFPRQVLVALVVLIVAAWYPLSRYGSDETIRGAIAGSAIATGNVLLGYAAIAYSIGKSSAVFFKAVLGGMGIRIAVMAGILLVLIKVFGFEPAALVVSLGICYMVFLALELMFIQKKISNRQQS